jgi:hypothetical protein
MCDAGGKEENMAVVGSLGSISEVSCANPKRDFAGLAARVDADMGTCD